MTASAGRTTLGHRLASWRWHLVALLVAVVSTLGLVLVGEVALGVALGAVTVQVALHGALAERGRRRQVAHLTRLTKALHAVAASQRDGLATSTQQVAGVRSDLSDDVAQVLAQVLARVDLRSEELRHEVREASDERDTLASARGARHRDALRRDVTSGRTVGRERSVR